MNTNIIQKKFLELEENLFDIKVDGIYVWEWMRYRVYQKILRELNIKNLSHTKVTKSNRTFLKATKLFINSSIFHNPFFATTNKCLIMGNPRRKLHDDNLWWDPYTDPITENCDFNYLQVETDYKLKHYKPSKTNNLRHLEVINFMDYLQRKLRILEVSIDKQTKNALLNAEKKFRNNFNVDLDLISRAENNIHRYASRNRLYSKFLNKIDPNIIILISSYGKESIIKTAHECEIPVIELQHGVINNNHMGYSFPGDKTKETFPDYLLTFGDYWNTAAKFPLPEDRIISVGYPYIEHNKSKFANNTSEDQIIFISQGSIGDKLSKFAIKAEKNPKIKSNIVYKLHPGEYSRWKDLYPWLKQSEITVIKDQIHLHKLMSESKAQVGVSSTAIYEGLMFNLDTYIYECFGSEIMEPLLSINMAKKINTSNPLAQIESGPENPYITEFFKENSIDNIRTQIKYLQENASLSQP